MPSYSLAFDEHGHPQLEEEFSGEHPDDASFRFATARAARRTWTSLLAERTAPEPPPCRADWELLPGAADPAQAFACDSQRAAPFGFQ